MLTFLLAKVFGSYMIIGGLAVLVRKGHFTSLLAAFVEERAARFVIAALDVLIGLLVVNIHPFWSPLPVALITLLGWVTLIKGVAGFFLKDQALAGLIRAMREKKLYMIEAAVILVLGVYLAGFGFGWFN